MNYRALPTTSFDSVEDLIPFSKIRLVVTDLDGTLVSSEGHDGSIWKPIKRLKRCINKYQVKFTIATGRTFSGVEKLLKDLDLSKGMPLILYNGSVVIRNKTFETLLKKTIPRQKLVDIINKVDLRKVQILAYFYKGFHFVRDNRLFSDIDLEYVLGWSKFGRFDYEFNKMPVKWSDSVDVPLGIEPSAILVRTENDSMQANLTNKILNQIDNITITKSGDYFLEIRPLGSDKGRALLELTGHLGYKLEEILAIGDNDNDIEMLSMAGIGVAVKNSSKRALENSDYACDYNSTAGAIEVFRLIREAKRYFQFEGDLNI